MHVVTEAHLLVLNTDLGMHEHDQPHAVKKDNSSFFLSWLSISTYKVKIFHRFLWMYSQQRKFLSLISLNPLKTLQKQFKSNFKPFGFIRKILKVNVLYSFTQDGTNQNLFYKKMVLPVFSSYIPQHHAKIPFKPYKLILNKITRGIF